MTVVWLTGLPATGKTTVAKALQSRLRESGISALLLDSDELREFLTPEPTYSREERDAFYSTLGSFASLASGQGLTVLVAATAGRRIYRNIVRARVDRFVEVLLVAGPKVLEKRDPKGLYKQAEAGEISRLPGRGTPYEDPLDPELVFDTTSGTATEIAKEIDDFLRHEPRQALTVAADARRERRTS